MLMDKSVHIVANMLLLGVILWHHIMQNLGHENKNYLRYLGVILWHHIMQNLGHENKNYLTSGVSLDYKASVTDMVAYTYLKRSIDIIKEVDSKEFAIYIVQYNKNSRSVFGYAKNI